MIVNRLNLSLLAAAAVISLAACSGNTTETAAKSEAPITVQTATAGGSSVQAGVIEASGQVEASQSVNISTRVMGYITQMKVKVGDRVSAGQLLFSVNSTDITAKRAQTDAMIAQAEAALRSAQKDFDRYTALYKQQSASAKELDQITLQYQSAKASVDAARQMRNEVNAQMTYAQVTAPFSGTITQKLADAGSMANPGMPVLTLEQSGNLQVSASIPENQIAAVQPGDEVKMSIESVNRLITGKVSQINPSSQFTGGQYIVKISVPAAEAKQLYAGMYVHLSIPVKGNSTHTTKEAGRILIPTKAIVTRDQLSGVYTVSSQNTALLRWLRLGNTTGDQVEVLSGLAANETFILSAEGNLYNGAPVTIKK